MITYFDACKVVLREGSARNDRISSETVSLNDALGRFISEDIIARDSSPRFDNSAMDGFAVSASDTKRASKENPCRLKVCATLSAGDEVREIVKSRSPLNCIQIMTGAMLPEDGYDGVVRIEDVREERDEVGELVSISISSPVSVGENVRFKGEDFKEGDLLLSRGTKIGPGHLLLLSTAGYSLVRVFRRPKVIVFSTGNEIQPWDAESLLPGKIRNSTAPSLLALLKLYGCEVFFSGVVHDDKEALCRALHAALEEHPDIIISTGGVSAGKFDLVTDTFRECGGSVHFHKVAVRPGKPLLFGEFGSGYSVLFGLPGNPIAVMASCRFFVSSYLRALLGGGEEKPLYLPLTEMVKKPEGLTFFSRGIVDGQGVRVLSGQASFMVSSLANAEGWIVLGSEGAYSDKGALVEWYPLW